MLCWMFLPPVLPERIFLTKSYQSSQKCVSVCVRACVRVADFPFITDPASSAAGSTERCDALFILCNSFLYSLILFLISCPHWGNPDISGVCPALNSSEFLCFLRGLLTSGVDADCIAVRKQAASGIYFKFAQKYAHLQVAFCILEILPIFSDLFSTLE